MNARRKISALWRDRGGVVAVEFALILPTIIVLFIGTFEASNLVRVKMKFDEAAPAIANLVAMQNPSKTGTLTSDFCAAANYMLAPFSTSGLNVQVASVTNYNGTSTIDWTANCNTLSNPKTATTLITGLLPNTGDSVIVVQTSYTYTAPIHMVLGSSYTFTNNGFSRPRSNSTVKYAP